MNECASKVSGRHFAGSGPISPSRELLLLLLQFRGVTTTRTTSVPWCYKNSYYFSSVVLQQRELLQFRGVTTARTTSVPWCHKNSYYFSSVVLQQLVLLQFRGVTTTRTTSVTWCYKTRTTSVPWCYNNFQFFTVLLDLTVESFFLQPILRYHCMERFINIIKYTQTIDLHFNY